MIEVTSYSKYKSISYVTNPDTKYMIKLKPI